jgi:hypothetical protein
MFCLILATLFTYPLDKIIILWYNKLFGKSGKAGFFSQPIPLPTHFAINAKARSKTGVLDFAKAKMDRWRRKMKLIVVPHGKKMAVKDLPPDFDKSDPPLTEEAKKEAAKLTGYLLRTYGPPLAIFRSPKLRCRQTAETLVHVWVDQLEKDPRYYVQLFTLESLAQTENGDAAPDHLHADKSGLVYYGPRSNSHDWYRWTIQSILAIYALGRMLQYQVPEARGNEAIYVYTHRPIVAGCRWIAQGKTAPTGADDIDALDKSLLPYCVFDMTCTDEVVLANPSFRLVEIPRPRD